MKSNFFTLEMKFLKTGIFLLLFSVCGVFVSMAQSINLKVGVGLYKSTTNFKLQERNNGVPASFNFRSQQQFNIIQSGFFDLRGISLPLWIEYVSKNHLSYRLGVVLGESIDLGYQRYPNYDATQSNTNVPASYVLGNGVEYGIFVTRFPIQVTLLPLDLLPVNKNQNRLSLAPLFGIEFMNIISASDNGVFSEPEPFFIVEDDGSLTYYQSSFAFGHYNAFNIFGSFGLSLRYHRKNKEILELLFTYRANLNPNASPFQGALKIEELNNTNPYDVIVYNVYNHRGNAFSLTLNFPIRLGFLNKRIFKE
jgi:hypothetical protein